MNTYSSIILLSWTSRHVGTLAPIAHLLSDKNDRVTVIDLSNSDKHRFPEKAATEVIALRREVSATANGEKLKKILRSEKEARHTEEVHFWKNSPIANIQFGRLSLPNSSRN